MQYYGSGFSWSRGPDPDAGSRRAKMTPKIIKVYALAFLMKKLRCFFVNNIFALFGKPGFAYRPGLNKSRCV
jgi:hypothetical protein